MNAAAPPAAAAAPLTPALSPSQTVKRIKGVKQVKIVDDKAKGGVNFNLLLETEWEGKIEDTWENEATLKATKVFSSGSPAVLWTP